VGHEAALLEFSSEMGLSSHVPAFVYYFIISVTYLSLSKGVWYFRAECLL
jgi:hypothetical protein